MSDDACPITNLEEHQTDSATVPRLPFPKPDSNLDLKNGAVSLSLLPDLVPKPDSNLEDLVQSKPDSNLVVKADANVSSNHSLNLDYREQASGIQSGQVPNINNVTIGDNNLNQGMQSLSINSGRNDASTDEKKIEDFLQSTKKLTKDDFPKLSKIFRKEWSFVGRNLGLTEHELFAIERDYAVEGFKEICYQMLCCWYKKDPSQCTVGNLAKALKKNDDTDLILQLPLGE